MKKYYKTKKLFSLISAFLIFLICSWTCMPIYAEPQNQENSASVNLSLDCKSALLMEAGTGKILYEQNADEKLPPASVTKVMTLLLVMEGLESGKIKYTDMLSASAHACSMGGSQIYLEEGEQMSVEDLVKSVVIASANDAAVVLAESISGTEEAFVEEMNKKAQELGMKNTCFENTNGLDDTVDNHLTSARDIAIMSRELIKYPKITEYSSIWMDSVRNGEFGLTNTNRLIRFYKGATGLKTGSTAKAGFCISATAQRDGMTLIAVIMGSPTRDVRNAAAVSLLDYGFSNYKLYSRAGEKIGNIPVSKGTKAQISARYNDFSSVLPKSGGEDISFKINMAEKINAPVKKGDVIGEVIYSIGGKQIGKSDIIAEESVDVISFGAMIAEFFRKFATCF